MRTLWYNKQVDVVPEPGTDQYSTGELVPAEFQSYVMADKDSANLIGSLTPKGTHLPTLDIDFPVYRVPSSTEGHYHLFIEKELTSLQYNKLMSALRYCELVQEGWYDTFKKMGCSFVRVPWIKKGDKPKKDPPVPNYLDLNDETALVLAKAWKCANRTPFAPVVWAEEWWWPGGDNLPQRVYVDSVGYKWPQSLLMYLGFYVNKKGELKKKPTTKLAPLIETESLALSDNEIKSLKSACYLDNKTLNAMTGPYKSFDSADNVLSNPNNLINGKIAKGYSDAKTSFWAPAPLLVAMGVATEDQFEEGIWQGE